MHKTNFQYKKLLYTGLIILLFLIHFFVQKQTKSVSSVFETRLQPSRTSLHDKEREKISQQFICEVFALGCFILSIPKDRNQLLQISGTKVSTQLECFVFCFTKPMSLYVGLFNGDTCLCSSDIDGFANLLNTSNSCDMKCPGEKSNNCGGKEYVETFKIKSCYENKQFPPLFQNSRLIGCFDPTSYVNNYVYQTSSMMCLAHCSAQQQPLAVWQSNQLQCSCDHFRPKFDLSLEQPSCDATSLEVFKSLAENQLCKAPVFLPKSSNVKRIGLISSPGSGNTWTRHLLEQATGIYTGSVYNDKNLYKAGFLGEKRSVKSNTTFIIKDHMLKNKNSMVNYDGAILLVRNPYRSIISDFNRQSAGRKHVGHANITLFYSEKFEKSLRRILNWNNVIKFVSESKKPFYLLLYEDLTQNPVAEIKKVMEFLEKYSDFKPKKLKQRLWCMSENLMGSFKRKPKTLPKDPFTTEMKQHINFAIKRARKSLNQVNRELTLPKYETPPHL